MAAIFLAAVLAVPQAASATTYAYDDFTDTSGSDPTAPDTTWGPAEYGGTWSEFASTCDSSPDDFSISGGKGVVATNDLAAEHDCQYIDISQQSVEYQGKVRVSATPSGGSVYAYLGVRVKDRDNAYRIRVEFTSSGGAQCLMQEEAANTTTTLPTTASAKTLSGSDYTGAGDDVYLRIEADATHDTVKGKCWSSTAEDPARGSWDWTATNETTLEGADYDGIQIRTTTVDAVTNSPSFEFDELNAHSLETTYTYDEFQRTYPSGGAYHSGGSGTSTQGDTWSEFSTACTTGNHYKVDGNYGKFNIPANASRCQRIDVGSTDAEVFTKVRIPSGSGNPAGASVYANIGTRVSDHDNRYALRAEFTNAGAVKCRPSKTVSGTTTLLGTEETLANYLGAGDWVYMKFQNVGDTIKGKCWTADEDEPGWMFGGSIAVTSPYPTSTGTYVLARGTSGALTTGSELEFDDFVVYPTRDADPLVAAVGDMACDHVHAEASFNSGDGISTGMSTSGWSQTLCWSQYTSDLICGTADGQCDPGVSSGSHGDYTKVLGLGDYQYECPAVTKWSESWSYPVSGSDNNWQRVQNVSALFAPVPGNHEYYTYSNPSSGKCSTDTDNLVAAIKDHTTTDDYEPGECYFQQLNGANAGGANDGTTDPCDPVLDGPANPGGNYYTETDGTVDETMARGYYSFDIGTWRFIGLNSQLGCSTSQWYPQCSTQKAWLQATLESNTQPCVAVYFHEPMFSSRVGNAGSNISTWWDVMYKGEAEDKDWKVDLVLNAHDHLYERFNKILPDGTGASDGAAQFIVGSGGKSVYKIGGASGVTGSVSSNTVFTSATHNFEDDDAVKFHYVPSDVQYNGGTGTLSTSTTYYVNRLTSTTFTLSLTANGDPIDLDDALASGSPATVLMELDTEHAQSAARNPDPDTTTPTNGWTLPTAGILELELEPNGYRYEFVKAEHAANGSFTDGYSASTNYENIVSCNTQ